MRAEAISSGGLSKGGNDDDRDAGGCHQGGRGQVVPEASEACRY